MNDKIRKNLNEVIDCIVTDEHYKRCKILKKKMEDNKEIKQKVEQIKMLQKQYVKSDFSLDPLKEQLTTLEEELLLIPIYAEYMRSLEEVNTMISYFKDEMNDYFTEVLNEELS